MIQAEGELERPVRQRIEATKPADARPRRHRARRGAPRGRSSRIVLAWGVHALTASGALLGAAALLAVARGDLRQAALWMLAALFVDAVDGSLARWVGTSEVLPAVDGRRLDDIVDYLNYVIVPMVFLIAAGGLTAPGWVAAPILASAYGFSRRDAKTDDGFFLGFPSYWNVLALYLWLLEVPAAVGTALVVGLAVLVLVPFKYVYPSQMPVLRRSTNAAAAVWIALLALAVAVPERAAPLRLAGLSLLFPAYYLFLSAWLGGLAGRPRGHE